MHSLSITGAFSHGYYLDSHTHYRFTRILNGAYAALQAAIWGCYRVDINSSENKRLQDEQPESYFAQECKSLLTRSGRLSDGIDDVHPKISTAENGNKSASGVNSGTGKEMTPDSKSKDPGIKNIHKSNEKGKEILTRFSKVPQHVRRKLAPDDLRGLVRSSRRTGEYGRRSKTPLETPLAQPKDK